VIDLYTWTTPNGRKASIMLEELGLPYTVHAVDISKDEQFKPEFLKVSPNNRIPAIVDRDTGISLMESAALMIYLADKTGKLLPKEGEPRYRVLEWLMWQMGGPGPMFGQVHHFVKYNKAKLLTRRSGFSRKLIDSMVCLTEDWRVGNSWRTSIPLRILRSGPGCRATNGRRWISTNIRTSKGGM
jgi:glutathione S-transferase